MSTATQVPTVTVTVGTFDYAYDTPIFRVARSESLRNFGSLAPDLYTPGNSVRGAGRHGGGGTPLRDATMEMIHHLDSLRSNDTILVGMLLDESGSMSGNEGSVIAGVNDFVEGLKEVPASEGGRVLCVIFTDGFENSSRHVSPEAMRQVVAEREADGWTFIFMGANVDAWAEGSSSLGISGGVTGQSVNFTSSPVGTASAFQEAGSRSRTYLSSQEDYAVMASAVGNNSTVTEGGDVITPGAPAAKKKPMPKPKPKPKPNPYADVSAGLDAASTVFDSKSGKQD